MPIDITNKEEKQIALTGAEIEETLLQAHLSKDAIAKIDGLQSSASEIDNIVTNGATKADLDALALKSSEGIIVFQTYALLDAYTPLTMGEQKGSFKVVNDSNASLNGYYSWVSGTSYIKDASLVANTISSTNTIDAVSGSAVAQELSALYNVTGRENFISGTNIFNWQDTENGEITTIGTNNSNAKYWRTKGFCKVEQLTDYKVNKGQKIYRICFFDSSQIFLSSATNNSTSFSTPAGCAFVRFMVQYDFYNNFHVCKVSEVNDIINFYDDLVIDNDKITSDTALYYSYNKHNASASNTGKLINLNDNQYRLTFDEILLLANTTNAGYWQGDLIKVEFGKTYLFYKNTVPVSVSRVSFFDSKKRFIGMNYNISSKAIDIVNIAYMSIAAAVTSPASSFMVIDSIDSTPTKTIQWDLNIKLPNGESFKKQYEQLGTILEKDQRLPHVFMMPAGTRDYQYQRMILNLKAKTLTVYSFGFKYDGVTINVPSQVLDLSSINLGYDGHCYYDFAYGSLKYGTPASVGQFALFWYYYNGRFISVNEKLLKLIDADGNTVKDTVVDNRDDINTLNSRFNYDEKRDRLILPNDVYFVDGYPLPVYKQSILSSRNQTDMIKLCITNDGQYDYFYENTKLIPSELADSFRISAKQYLDSNYVYHKDINKNSVSADANTGKTVVINCIGDSLTGLGVVPSLLSKLVSFGVSATSIGTQGYSSEGHGGWKYANFVGSNNYANNAAVTSPFLKVADTTDKTNHPDWCFRNTGSTDELSYASDPVKTGDFYIFDYAFYLSNNGLSTPDIITIALGTNDLWDVKNESVLSCKASLNIMITQIKSALPDVIIGVIPLPAPSSNNISNYRWNRIYCNWIEVCITDIEVYKLTYNNLYVIPCWMHMNRDFNFSFSSSNDLSLVNTSKKSYLSEAVHFNSDGVEEYANVTSAFVMNVI